MMGSGIRKCLFGDAIHKCIRTWSFGVQHIIVPASSSTASLNQIHLTGDREGIASAPRHLGYRIQTRAIQDGKSMNTRLKIHTAVPEVYRSCIPNPTVASLIDRNQIPPMILVRVFSFPSLVQDRFVKLTDTPEVLYTHTFDTPKVFVFVNRPTAKLRFNCLD